MSAFPKSGSHIHVSVHISRQVRWLVVTEVWSTSFGLALHVQHTFANSWIFWGLLVIVLHSTCIFCVYGMAQYWPTLQFYACLYISSACQYVTPPGECCYNTLLCCNYFSSSSVVLRAYSALCVYSKFRHHPHPLGYHCAKFCFFRCLHCWASTWRKTAYSINHSTTHSLSHPAYLMPQEPKLALHNT